jgi:biopolymer transport protein ExbD
MASAARPVSDINITPLIDVMLVLLIIFMVVVPVASRGLDAALPRPDTSASEGKPAPIVLNVDSSGFTLDAKPILTLDELRSGLRDILVVRREKTVFVRAAGEVAYGRVVEAVDAARGAGAERIGLVSNTGARRPAPR